MGQAPLSGAQTLSVIEESTPLCYLEDFLGIVFAFGLDEAFVGFNFLDNLDFILAALFLWITFVLAARSTATKTLLKPAGVGFFKYFLTASL